MNRTPVRNPNKSSIKSGLIYKITAPGPKYKSYIGQTILKFEDRWRKHIYAASVNKKGCRYFEKAINKYKPENFTTEILLICSEDLLDFYEKMFIDVYQTLAPHGYNLREGGNGDCTEEMRRQMVIGNNKKLLRKAKLNENEVSVKYVNYCKEVNKNGTVVEGYCVEDHPNGSNKSFVKSKMTLEERRQAAISYKEFLDKHDGFYDGRKKTPKYIHKYNKTGYCVHKPGHPRKHYHSNSQEENYNNALEYLEVLNKLDKCTEDLAEIRRKKEQFVAYQFKIPDDVDFTEEDLQILEDMLR